MKSNRSTIDKLVREKPRCMTPAFLPSCTCVHCTQWLDELYQYCKDGTMSKALREVRDAQPPALQKYKYMYALTINAGSDLPTLERTWERVIHTKPFRGVTGIIVYEVFSTDEDTGAVTETFPHIHAFLQSNTYINPSDLQKATKCSTKLDRLKTSLDAKRWLKYIHKYYDHLPSEQWFLENDRTTNYDPIEFVDDKGDALARIYARYKFSPE